jgi:MFS family permease
LKTKHETHKVRKSLRLSVLDGSAYAALIGLTQNFITPLALELKASTFQIAMLSSVPSFTTAMAQLTAPNLSERAGSRKGFIVPVLLAHALMFIPIMLVPYIFHVSAVWWLIGFVTISTVLGSITFPPWGSMMADLVPERLRGRYFGNRGMIMGFITQVFFYMAGGILTLFSSAIFTGYAVLFAGATLFRLVSLYFLSRMYEPAQAVSQEKGPNLLAMIKNIGSSNLGKFILYFSLIDFCTLISGPFFTVFMLRDLSFSYIMFVIVSSASQISSLLFLTFWGRRADKWGNLKVVQITSLLVPLVPIFWVFCDNIFYLIAANIVSGFAWSGFGLAGVNFAYDASEPDNRTKYLAIFAAIDGLACCLGALLGGYIVPHLPVIFSYQLRTLFLISGVLRGVVVLFMLRQIKEVRNVSSISSWQLITGRANNGDDEKARGKFSFHKRKSVDEEDSDAEKP